MLKIGLLEDEQDQARLLTQFLSQYREAHPQFAYTLQSYSRALDLLNHYERDFDLLFLDIRLPDMTGMEVAHRIRESDRNVMIIFVTSLTQYAVEGYSVNAFDYILKPISFDPFAAKLERALRVLSYGERGVMLDIKTREGGLRLSSDMIHYFEIFDHELIIHTDEGIVKQWGSLSKYEKQLANAHFARCNSCYLVNLKFVRSVSSDEVLVGDARLSVSKSRRKAFLQALAQYRGGTR